MAKVTSKLQVTIPKDLAERLHLRPGDEIDWQVAGGVIQILPAGGQAPSADAAARLEAFDAATARRDARHAAGPRPRAHPHGRGWARAALYGRRARAR